MLWWSQHRDTKKKEVGIKVSAMVPHRTLLWATRAGNRISRFAFKSVCCRQRELKRVEQHMHG